MHLWARYPARTPASRACGPRDRRHPHGPGSPGPLTGHDYPRSHTSSDAIVLLKNDHKEIRRLFRDFEGAGDNATTRKGQLVDRMIELLTVHTYIENEVMYPRVRALLPELENDVLESYEEHHVADVLVMELSGMKPGADRGVRRVAP